MDLNIQVGNGRRCGPSRRARIWWMRGEPLILILILILPETGRGSGGRETEEDTDTVCYGDTGCSLLIPWRERKMELSPVK